MSQPGQKPAASPRPRRAAAARHTQEHADGKTSGSPSKSGEKRGSDEKKAPKLRSSQPSRTQAGGTAPVTKVTTSSASTRKSSSMNPTETKVVKTEPEKKSQSTKPSVVHEKKTQEVKPKEHTEPKSVPKHSPDTGSKHTHNEKAVSRSSEQPTSEKSTIPKTKSQDTISSGGKSAVTGIAAASGKPVDKSGMDAALDDLIDTLGEPEETKEDNTTYTGPEVLDPMSSTYIEELGKREVTLPPKYRELLNKPLGPDDAIDALSSDFTCSSPMADGKKTKKEKSTGEVLKAQSAEVIKSAAPPKEKKRKVEEDTMSDQALEALSASLGSRKPEPELDLSSIKEVNEAKAKEEKLKKCGEDEESVPPEYRLKPAMDKDGKPLLPDVEEKPKPLSESELIDELSEDLDRSKCKEKQPKPTEKTEESQAAAPTPVGAAVPRTTLCCVQSVPPPSVSAVEDRILLRSENSTVFLRRPANPGQPSTEVWSPSGIGKGMGPDDAVEALAGSLGKKEAGPEVGKPVEDKVKEEAKEDREKLGEKEETIPPDYRLEEVKDKDGKPLLPKEPKEPLPPSSEDFLLDALSKDFAVTPSTSSLQFEDAKLSAVISEVVSQTPAPTNHSAGPPPDTPQRDDKELDDALDQLSDRLGQRQPDPDENKPLEDKVKEKAKAEHRDKLGERDDTIPPEYRHLLDDDKEGKSATPPTEKPEASKKPADAQEPIDALSGDFDSCPSTTETSENTAKDKDEKTASSSKAPKNGGKAKDSAKAKEETSKRKADGKSTS
ncbi:calpastatin isoform X4 [Physeter macrocephalus]|uniref:Calpastatin n=1 Tax=Physeter macrocephalus TaxID=9755 RepID=A0A2Y9T8R1_PHYMC|nr:calpastatin isoform X4 [Physeter catodon]|eukprot:XP_023987321.1 calpastatin isoform X3 [Physeter catodon]